MLLGRERRAEWKTDKGKMELTRKQTEALDYLEDGKTIEVLFGGGAGGGKSVLGCYWLLKCALKYPGSRYLMARRAATTLRQTTLNTLRQVARLQGLPASWLRVNDQRGEVAVGTAGSVILMRHLQARPSDPEFDELGSLEITGAFIDECNQVSLRAWNVVRSRIRYRLGEYGLVPKMLGTCNPSKGFVYSRFYKPFRDGTLEPDKRFVESLLRDNPFISPHYAESLRGLDSRSVQRLLCGNWEYQDDPMALMAYDRIVDVFSNTGVASGERFITADIARFGDDSTVICLWNGLRCEKIVVRARQGVDATARDISALASAAGVPLSHIVCDEDGVGGGVADLLKCKGFCNNASPVDVRGKKQNFTNLKSQCYFLLADAVGRGQVYVAVDDPQLRSRIIEELEQVRAVDVSGEGRLAVVPKARVKEVLGRSPDVADALMMRMYFVLHPPGATKDLARFFG